MNIKQLTELIKDYGEIIEFDEDAILVIWKTASGAEIAPALRGRIQDEAKIIKGGTDFIMGPGNDEGTRMGKHPDSPYSSIDPCTGQTSQQKVSAATSEKEPISVGSARNAGSVLEEVDAFYRLHPICEYEERAAQEDCDAWLDFARFLAARLESAEKERDQYLVDLRNSTVALTERAESAERRAAEEERDAKRWREFYVRIFKSCEAHKHITSWTVHPGSYAIPAKEVCPVCEEIAYNAALAERKEK